MSKKILRIIILAAGQGTRMLSKTPKVLHKIAGKPMIKYIIDTAMSLKPSIINLIYSDSDKSNLIKSTIKNNFIKWTLQKKQLGTGHAIQQVSSQFSEKEDVLILYGDVPLISAKTLKKMYYKKPKNGLCLITKKINNPCNYGRILRKNGKVIGIIETKDANFKQLLIKEINTGIIIVNSIDLKRWLKKIENKNSKKEYYVTDIVSFAYKEKKQINTISPLYNYEIKGVNNFIELAYIEKIYRSIKIKKLLLSGLKLHDPKRFDIRGNIKHGKDVFIDVNVLIEGKVVLGNDVKIGTGCIIKNSTIGNNCIIHPYSIIEYSEILENCIIGPFAILRQKNKIGSDVKVGNFVEIKQTNLGKLSKVKHLSYLGNSQIGSQVNIGAGTVTCNFNGLKKYNTVIGDNVFVGATSQLIAPIHISKNVTVAAGTTVMKSIKSEGLVYNKKKQMLNKKWKKKILSRKISKN